MAGKSRGSLTKWEVSIVKAMLRRGYIPQDVHAYFSRPSRSINQARISQIKDAKLHAAVKAASDEELDMFLDAWPNVDPSTGLHLGSDELLIKAREAMIAAVHTFNSAGLFFRSELFIVTAIIAWTYLMHAYFKRKGIDYRYKKSGVVQKTKHGAEKHWELGKCISDVNCPLEKGVVDNLNFLLEIRHEIEHQSTNKIDDALSAKLQACCINFNDALKQLFGREYSLEKSLSIALQFVTFDGLQRASLVAQDLPENLATAMDEFHNSLSDAEQADPKFRYRVAFVPKAAGKASKADLAIEFVKPDSDQAKKVERVLLKETERPKYRPTAIVNKAKEEGFGTFSMHDHTIMVRQLNARNAGKGYGVDVSGQWYWYDNWLEKVLEKLNEGWSRP